jgi:hypothetical protein
MFEGLTTEQLRSELAAYNRTQDAKAEPALPLPPATPPGLNDAQKEQLFQNYIEHIDAKDPQTWTRDERRAYEFNAARILRQMGR